MLSPRYVTEFTSTAEISLSRIHAPACAVCFRTHSFIGWRAAALCDFARSVYPDDMQAAREYLWVMLRPRCWGPPPAHLPPSGAHLVAPLVAHLVAPVSQDLRRAARCRAGRFSLRPVWRKARRRRRPPRRRGRA